MLSWNIPPTPRMGILKPGVFWSDTEFNFHGKECIECGDSWQLGIHVMCITCTYIPEVTGHKSNFIDQQLGHYLHQVLQYEDP